MELIVRREYSQFPVFAGQFFKGLLTENGITRWFAHHASAKKPLPHADEAQVHDLLAEEEKREKCAFVGAETTVHAIRLMFAEMGLLEAALITSDGLESDELLGIATRWDMLTA